MGIEGYPKIMVVEDDLDLRDIYTELLEHSGFYVTGFADGQEAVAAIKSGDLPQLIVLDYLLPGMNGRQFLEALANLPAVTKIPIILVSALAGETPEIIQIKSHPWVVASFTKTDITNAKLVDFVKAYFGLS